MRKPWQIGVVDLAVVTVLLVMVVLPPREMFASPAAKGPEPEQFAFALTEARTFSDPDGQKVSDFARRLSDLNFKDWSVEAAVAGSKRAVGSPTEWKALLAASVAYVDKVDVVPALEYAGRALASCRALKPDGCPSWEDVRMSLYFAHLEAGAKSGIDPRIDPKGFRRAGEAAIRSGRLTPAN